MSAPALKLKPVALAVAFVFPSFAFAAAGRIDFAVGDVKALGPDGRARPLAKGDEFNSGETIETGDGRVWLRFTDGAQVSLQPQSQYRIDNYRFNGQADGEERGFFNLLKGGLRTITGWVGRTNRKNYQVTTAVATIGIRGTEFSIVYGNSITVTTAEGEVEVCNTAGCLDLSAGESGYVSSIDSKPILIEKKADLPPTPPLPEPQFSVANNANGSSGGAAIIGAAPGLISGPGYSLAWASPSAIDTINTHLIESTGTATFDGTSTLTAYSTGTHTYSPSGFADVGTDGVIGWGRWTSGTGQVYAPSTLLNVAYLVGTPTATMPTTSATYTLIGSTRPTDTSGASGTLTAASFSANFGAGTTSGAITVTMPAGTADLFWNNVTFTGSTFSLTPNQGTVGLCTGLCAASINGFFVGAGASRAGFTYNVSGPGFNTFSGAAAFTKN